MKAETLMPLVIVNVEREARIMTDEHSGYRDVKHYFASHGTTSHGKGEYVNLENRSIHSNTVEGYFSIFKRGMKGVYGTTVGGRTSSAYHRAQERAEGEVDPVGELPYRPAELRRANRPDRWQHPTKARPDFTLAT